MSRDALLAGPLKGVRKRGRAGIAAGAAVGVEGDDVVHQGILARGVGRAIACMRLLEALPISSRPFASK
jgi:hypothetical protein